METKEIKELTKAEEQVMQAIWKIERGFAGEIVEAVGGGVAYNTVLTVVRILEQKGFVGHETFNRSNRYYPLVSREEYMKRMLGGIAHRWFGSSPRALVSFLVDKNEVSLEDLEAITKELER
ncbi:MAG: BlaI/MecI/CopY family transcriptional regulator [Bacteroidales bacterium]|nr:BlaI/MecI/CopY family transcriptional regulator [Bacteroidales bacterium]